LDEAGPYFIFWIVDKKGSWEAAQEKQKGKPLKKGCILPATPYFLHAPPYIQQKNHYSINEKI